MKVKRLVALLLSLCMIFALAACGEKTGEESKAPESSAPVEEQGARERGQ